MVTVWCSAAPLIHCSFVNPHETITPEKNAQQMDEMHGKLQHWHRSRERAQFSRQRPTTCTTTQSWTNWATKFCLICHTHLTLANQLPLLEASWQLFAGKMLPQPAGCRKCFPRVHWISKHGFFFFCYGNKQIFLIGKNVLVVMVPILITKDVFEPSYNELKFRIRNCYYFCINLISWLWATMLYA